MNNINRERRQILATLFENVRLENLATYCESASDSPFHFTARCLWFVAGTRRACLVDINAGYKWISDTFEEAEKCSLSQIKLFKTEMLAMPVAKRSGYREIIAQKLCWQQENGLYDKIAATWIPPKPRCVGDSGGFTSVGTTDFLPAILALIYGCSIATFILILELLYKHRTHFRSMISGPGKDSDVSTNKRDEMKRSV
uniref:Ionotropic receptor 5 n=1 Tax=Cyrtorhinus lividipennis TaxID=1032904 RepID=A0A346TI28_9HEMI|nr:ionotropic receptor 5 [Cyrtorhinus lividipennis]